MPHLYAEEGADAGLGGVADGREVVTSLQGQDHTTSRQRHQLTRQEAETYTDADRHMKKTSVSINKSQQQQELKLLRIIFNQGLFLSGGSSHSNEGPSSFKL